MKKKAEGSRNFSAMMIIVMLSILFVLMGSLMTFLEGMKSIYFCYVTAGFFLLGGAWLSIRYFVKEEYRQITNYDFSFGVLMLLGGVLLCIRAKDILPAFFVLLGALLLVEAVFLLQFAIMMKIRESAPGSILIFAFAAAVTSLSLLILLDPDQILEQASMIRWFYIGVMIAGILGLLSLLIVGVTSGRAAKETSLAEEEAIEEKEPDPLLDDPEERERKEVTDENESVH
ncbi:MAG: DUF308 domain-containing protein [Lachnospiraceae bacterium]|nr:DUF308 domain-containing protein [Lachnospiraceae bacterium]